MASLFKKTRVELELLTNIDKSLMVGKGITGGMCPAIHIYAKANNKYVKNCDKCRKSRFLIYLYANNLYGYAMSQKFRVNGFKWVKELSKFNKDSIKKYNENSNKGYNLEVDGDYPQNLFKIHQDLPFLPERKKIEKCYKLDCNIQDKKNMLLI